MHDPWIVRICTFFYTLLGYVEIGNDQSSICSMFVATLGVWLIGSVSGLMG